MAILDEAGKTAKELPWTFGGGTVLMFRYAHRISTDIDLFLPDPQYLGHVSPSKNEVAESLTDSYEEGAGFLKLVFPEGEIDFVCCGWLTDDPWEAGMIEGRDVRLERTAEIIGKKLWFRADRFKARDLFDFSIAAVREPLALEGLGPVMSARRDVLAKRLDDHEAMLRNEFAALDLLDRSLSFDDCVRIVQERVGKTG
ncbi:MAG TPA: nucleotidyl transferase AbiEii/AbiGii toxin family protein [Usitatibacteraceae bacterium]|nr:nucleotidyl transferase AbiEii/AbiGii toxin family protein [Usitatibacteraceae bacterium]